MKYYISAAILTCLLSLSSSNAQAQPESINEVGVSYGWGIDVSEWVQVDIIQPIEHHFAVFNTPVFGLNLQPFVDIGLATNTWKRFDGRSYHISPTFLLRSQSFITPAGHLLFEAGFGPHLISNPSQTRRLSTGFEFNSLLGVGLSLSQQWSLHARVRHVSNGGIKSPNAGVNIYLWELHYHY